MTRHEAEPPQPNDTTQRRAVALTVLLAMVIVVARAGASVCLGKFSGSSGQITDHETGLVWQAATHGTSDWPTANGACSSPWRLPTALELQTIIDDDTLGFADPFPDAGVNLGYWSSSPPGNAPSNPKFYVVSNGVVNKDPQNIKHRSRCVRLP